MNLQWDSMNVYMKVQGYLFGNPNKVIWKSRLIVDTEMCFDGNTNNEDGGSRSLVSSKEEE